ncbi:Titin homolog [Caenorhabditis elegans]|nr:Titin homolog [Caenorhabditis elegans]SOT38355.1 Titin homolog [Caenorhabditis elegans]|eukprot:NP_001346727.1 Titin homolog [Caenorhabditis elegans]
MAMAEKDSDAMEVRGLNKKLSKKGGKEGTSTEKSSSKTKKQEKSALSVQEMNKSLKKKGEKGEAETAASDFIENADQTGMSIQDLNKSMKKKVESGEATGQINDASNNKDADELSIQDSQQSLKKKSENESVTGEQLDKSQEVEDDKMTIQSLKKSIKKKPESREVSGGKSEKSKEKESDEMSIQQLNKSVKKKPENEAVTQGKSGKSQEQESDKMSIQALNKSMKKKDGVDGVEGNINIGRSDGDQLSVNDIDAELSTSEQVENASQNLGATADSDGDSLSLQTLKKRISKKGIHGEAESKLGEKQSGSDSFTLQDLYEELKAKEDAVEAGAETSNADQSAEKTSLEVRDMKKKMKKKQVSGTAENLIGESNRDETSMEIRDLNTQHSNQTGEDESSTFNFGQKDQEQYSMVMKDVSKKLARQNAEEIQSGKLIPTTNEEKTGLALTGKNKNLKKGEENEKTKFEAKHLGSSSASDSLAESTLRSKKTKKGEVEKSELSIDMKNQDKTTLATTLLEDDLAKTTSAEESEAEHLVALQNKEKTSLAMRRKRVSFDSSTKSESIEDVIPDKNRDSDKMSITGIKKKMSQKSESAEAQKNESPEVKEISSFEEKTLKSKKKSKADRNQGTEANLGDKTIDKDYLSVTDKNQSLEKSEASGQAEKSIKAPNKSKVTTSFADESLTSELDRLMADEEMAEMMFAEEEKAADLLNVMNKNKGLNKSEQEESQEISLKSQSKVKDSDSLSSTDKKIGLKKSDKDQKLGTSKIFGSKDQESVGYEEKTSNFSKQRRGVSDLGSDAMTDQKNVQESQYAEISADDHMSKTGADGEISATRTIVDGSDAAQGSEYAEISKKRKFKRAEQIGEAETSLCDSRENTHDSLSISDVNPELRRSNVEISAFGQIDLTAEEVTSLTDINKDAQLTKKQDENDAKKSVSKNLKAGAKKDSDTLSITSKKDKFGKRQDSREASATVEQQGEEKVTKNLKGSRGKKEKLGDAGIDVNFENQEEFASTTGDIESIVSEKGHDTYSEKTVKSSKKKSPQTAGAEYGGSESLNASSALSTTDVDAQLKNQEKDGVAESSIGKSNQKDSYSEQELNVNKKKKQAVGAAMNQGSGSTKESDNLAVASVESNLAKDSANQEASLHGLVDNDATSLSQLDSEHRLKKRDDELSAHTKLGKHTQSENIALTETDDSLVKGDSEESAELNIKQQGETAEDKYVESRKKTTLKKKPEQKQVTDTLSAVDGRHDTTSLSVADSGISFDKSMENELAGSGDGTASASVSAKVRGADGNAKTNLISSFEKPGQESKTSKTLSGKQKKQEKSSFAEKNAGFDLSMGEGKNDESVESSLQKNRDADSLALQGTDLAFSKPSDSSANAHLDMPQRELTLRICQAETVDWSDDSEVEEGTRTSAPGEVKKKKKFIISAISQDGEFSDAESITFDENGVRVEKRRRKKRDPKEYMGAGELAMRIPAFAKKMQYIGCIEGDVVVFTIKVVSDDVPLIRMYRNDFPVANFDKMAFEGFTKGSEHSFNVTINDIRKLDGGKLVFEAKNDYGVDKCTILLDVRDSGSFIEDYSEIHRSAEIQNSVGDVQVKEGETAKLTGRVDGFPLPELIWIKNGKEIDMMVPSTKYQLDYHSDGEFEARIANCTFEDDDDYSLLVENLAGVDSCNFQVFVDCNEYPDDEHFNRRRRLQRGRRVMEASSDSELDDAKKRKKRRIKRVVERRNPNAPRLTQLIPPRFDKILSDHDAIEGENVVMMVETLGEPEPQVRFYRDGKLIDDGSGDRMEVRHEDEMRKHWLILKDICKDEEAEYACQAINVAGEAWCFSDVVVHMSEESRDDDKSVDEVDDSTVLEEKKDDGDDKSKPKTKKKIIKKKETPESEQVTAAEPEQQKISEVDVQSVAETEVGAKKKPDAEKPTDLSKAKKDSKSKKSDEPEASTEEKSTTEKPTNDKTSKKSAEKKTVKPKKEVTGKPLEAKKPVEDKKDASQPSSSKESSPPTDGKKKKQIPKALFIPDEISSRFGDPSTMHSETNITTTIRGREGSADAKTPLVEPLSASVSMKVESAKEKAEFSFKRRSETPDDKSRKKEGLPPAKKSEKKDEVTAEKQSTEALIESKKKEVDESKISEQQPSDKNKSEVVGVPEKAAGPETKKDVSEIEEVPKKKTIKKKTEKSDSSISQKSNVLKPADDDKSKSDDVTDKSKKTTEDQTKVATDSKLEKAADTTKQIETETVVDDKSKKKVLKKKTEKSDSFISQKSETPPVVEPTKPAESEAQKIAEVNKAKKQKEVDDNLKREAEVAAKKIADEKLKIEAEANIKKTAEVEAAKKQKEKDEQLKLETEVVSKKSAAEKLELEKQAQIKKAAEADAVKKQKELNEKNKLEAAKKSAADKLKLEEESAAKSKKVSEESVKFGEEKKTKAGEKTVQVESEPTSKKTIDTKDVGATEPADETPKKKIIKKKTEKSDSSISQKSATDSEKVSKQKEQDEPTKPAVSETQMVTEADKSKKQKETDEKLKLDAEIAAKTKQEADEKSKLDAQEKIKKVSEDDAARKEKELNDKLKLESEIATKKASADKLKLEEQAQAKKAAEVEAAKKQKEKDEQLKLDTEAASKKAAAEKLELEKQAQIKKAAGADAVKKQKELDEKNKLEANKKSAAGKLKIEEESAAKSKQTVEEQAKLDAQTKAKTAEKQTKLEKDEKSTKESESKETVDEKPKKKVLKKKTEKSDSSISQKSETSKTVVESAGPSESETQKVADAARKQKETDEKQKLEAEITAKKSADEKSKLEAESKLKKAAEVEAAKKQKEKDEQLKLDTEAASKKAAAEKLELEKQSHIKKAAEVDAVKKQKELEEKQRLESEAATKKADAEKLKLEEQKKKAAEIALIEIQKEQEKLAQEQSRLEDEAKKSAEKQKLESETKSKQTEEAPKESVDEKPKKKVLKKKTEKSDSSISQKSKSAKSTVDAAETLESDFNLVEKKTVQKVEQSPDESTSATIKRDPAQKTEEISKQDDGDEKKTTTDGKPPKPEDSEATPKKRVVKKKTQKSDSVASDASLADVSKLSDDVEEKPKKKVLKKKTEKSDSVISETSSVDTIKPESVEIPTEKAEQMILHNRFSTDSAVESEPKNAHKDDTEKTTDDMMTRRKSSAIFSDDEQSISSKTSSEGRRRRRRTGFASKFASDTLALRGDNVEIEAELLAEDDTVTWKVNGKDADLNSRCHEMSHTFFRTLIIDEVEPTDSGMEITATCGTESHTTILKVEELPVDFVKYLPRKTSGKEGQEVTISVTLNHPIDISKVVWLKDGKPLEINKDYSIDTVGCSVSLTLRRAKYEDSGKYKVVCDGVDCSTHLSIQGKPVLKNVSETKPVITVDKDDQFSLLVAYDSNPEASFSMTVDGKDLEFDGRSRIDVVDDGLKLTKRGVSKTDAGEYEVKLKNEFGEVAQKFDVKVNDTPSAPGDVSVVKAESDCLHIEWTAPTEDNGAEVTSYVIEKKESGRRKFHKVATVNGKKTSYVVDDLEIETPYIVRIAAVNKFGTGEFIETKPVQTGSPFQVPTVEFPPTIDNVTSTSCSLSWPKPIEDGGSPVYGYDVYKRENEGEWQKMNGEELVFTESFNVRALSSGKEYEFKIEACNEAGLRSNSNVVSKKLTVEGLVPEIILDMPMVKVLDNDKVEVTWKSDGEKEFVVQYKSDGSSIWASVDIGGPRSESAATSKCIIDGLREGIPYVFRVAARNQHGTGEFSEPTIPVVVLADDAPRVLKAIKPVKIPKKGELRLECHAAGHPAPEYIWYKDGKEIIPTDENTEIVNEGSMSALIIHELAGEDVGLYKVLVENIHGTAESEAEVGISDVRAHFNSSFSELTEIEEGHDIELTCEVSDEEAVVNWYKDGKKLVASDRVQFYAMARKRTLRIKGSTDADSGVYKCETTDGRSRTEGEVIVNEQEPHILVGPQDAIVKDFGETMVLFCETSKPVRKVKWFKNGVEIWPQMNKAIMENDGKRATLEIKNFDKHDIGAYTASVSEKETSAPAKLVFEVAPNLIIPTEIRDGVTVHAGNEFDFAVEFSGFPIPTIHLTNNGTPLKAIAVVTEYDDSVSVRMKDVTLDNSGTVRVIAESPLGQCIKEIPLKIIDKPSAPCDLQFKEVTEDSVFLSWQPPLETNGAPLTGYVIERKAVDNNRWRPCGQVKPTKLTFVAEDLFCNQVYGFRILAVNEVGESEPCDTVDVLTLESSEPVSESSELFVPKIAILRTPQVTVAVDETKVTLRWEECPETSLYKVERKKVGDSDWLEIANTDRNKFKDRSLTESGEYVYQVTATGIHAVSSPSEETNPVKILVPGSEMPASKTEKKTDAAKSESEQKSAEEIVAEKQVDQSQASESTTEAVEEKKTKKVVKKKVAENKGEETLQEVKEKLKKGKAVEKVQDESRRGSLQASSDNESVTTTSEKRSEAELEKNSEKSAEKKSTSADLEAADKAETEKSETGKETTEKKKKVVKKVAKKGLVKADKSKIELTAGKEGEISAQVAETGVSVEWKKDGKALDASYTVTSTGGVSTVKIPIVDVNTSGVFTCKVKSSEGDEEEVSIAVTVKLPEVPKVEAEQSIVEVKVGDVAKLSAKISEPASSVNWTKDDKPIKEDGNVKAQLSPDGTAQLTISKTDSAHSGIYKLNVENDAGKGKVEIALRIKGAAKGAPGIPTGPIVFDDVTESSAEFSWKAPENNGGCEITGYNVERKESKNKGWKQCGKTKELKFKADGLEEGTDYDVKVSAVNTMGTGSALEGKITTLKKKEETGKQKSEKSESDEKKSESDKVSELKQIGKPEYVSSTATSIALKWTSDNDEVTYTVQMKEANSKRPWAVVAKEISECSATIAQLKEGTSYLFRVIAQNKTGQTVTSEQSESIECKDTTESKKPAFTNAPTDLTAVKNGKTKITAEFTGHPAPEIHWFKNKKEIFSGKRQWIENIAGATSLTIGEMREDDEGEYKIVVKNTAGSVEHSCKLTMDQLPEINRVDRYASTLVFDKGETVKLRLSFSGRPQPEVIWIDNNGKVIEESRKMKIEKTVLNTVLTINSIDSQDQGEFALKIKNRCGEDKYAIGIQVTDRPAAPGKPAVEDQNVDSVRLRWAAPTNDGGSPVRNYTVEMCTEKGKTWTKAEVTKQAFITLFNLVPGESYRFRVRADNTFGQSEPSDESELVVVKNVSRVVEEPKKKEVKVKEQESVDYERVAKDSEPSEYKTIDIHRLPNDLQAKYIIHEELGKGAYGTVYRATEKATGKTWAAKMVQVRPGVKKENVIHEISMMNQLHHEKLLNLHEAFDMGNEMWLIEEFVSGGELFEKILEDDSLMSEEEVRDYMHQILLGVSHMHKNQIVHLDLKPENILLKAKNSNELKIIDFGLARKLDPKKSVKLLFGTPEFCAPEVVNYQPVGLSTDMWTVGVISYVLLSGLSPFLGDSDEDTLANVSASDWDFDDPSWDDVSDLAKDFICRLMIKDKRKRMSVQDALRHPWITGPLLSAFNDLSEYVKKMQPKLDKSGVPARQKRNFLSLKRWSDDLLPIGRLAKRGAIFRRLTMDGVFERNIAFDTDAAPSVKKQLEDIVANVGDLIATLSCDVDGVPSPKVQWYKDDKELTVPSMKYDSFYNEGLAELTVKNIVESDAGKYTCRATNDLGSIMTHAKLSVKADEKKKKKSKTSPAVIEKKKDRKTSKVVVIEEMIDMPPNFHHLLQDDEAKIGEPKILVVTNTTLPEPTVDWYHNGEHISINDSNYLRKHDKGRYELHILSVDSTDEGKWKAVGKNAFGECESEAKLTVVIPDGQYAPSFGKQLSDVKCSESDILKLEVNIQANPAPEINWFRNESEIEHSQHHRLQFDDGSGNYSLTIIDAYAEDSGEYKCVAKNKIGKAHTVCCVRIEELLSKRSKKIDGSKAPRFRMQLPTPREVPQGADLTLVCSVSGTPHPNIKWTKDDKPIDMSNKQVRHENGVCTLHIIGARDDDQGRYVCEAENIHGVAQSFSVVEIKEAVDKDHVRPKFLEPLVNCSTCEGNEMVLECCVTGKPIPTITWYKDGLKLIIENRMLQYTDRKGVSRLNIMNVVMNDDGEYTCEAVNSLGKDFTHCTVKVVDMGLSKTRLTPVRSRSRSRSRSPSVVGGEIQRPPVVTRPLADATVTEGNRELLEVEVDGFPTPTIEWYHDGKLVAESRTLRTYFDGRVAFLKIYEAHEEHNGQYVCKVSNKLGAVETRAIVVVEAPDAAEHVTQMPTFVKKLQDVVLKTAGETATFTCQSYANPAAQVVWLHNGKALQQTKSNYKTRLFDDNTATLVIENVTDELCGTYTAVANNQFGDVHTSAQLTISGSEAKKIAASLPYFIIELKPKINVVEGATLSIQADLNGSPIPEVVWLKDNSELVESDRIQMKCDGVNYQLLVRDVGLEDEGTYTITAENEKGKIRQNTEVSVTKSKEVKEKKEKKKVEKKDEGKKKPGRPGLPRPSGASKTEQVTMAFDAPSEGPADSYEVERRCPDQREWVSCGSTKSLELEIKGLTPNTEYIFRVAGKNKQGLGEWSEMTSTLKTASVGQAPQFTISPQSKIIANRDDEFEIAVEFSGTPTPSVKWYKENLQIVPDEKIDVATTSTSSILNLKSQEENGTFNCLIENELGQASASCQVTIFNKPASLQSTPDHSLERNLVPTLQKALNNESAQAGQQIMLTCRISSRSESTVAWFKDDERIESAGRYELSSDKKSNHKLVCHAVQSQDTGKYRCVVTNKYGYAESECNVAVEDVTKFIAPSFSATLSDSTAILGHNITLECKVEGSPAPEVSWTKDGERISTTRRIRQTQDENGNCKLSISKAESDDMGVYVCSATSVAGVDSTSSMVMIAKTTGTDSHLVIAQTADEKHEKPRFTRAPPSLIEVNESGQFTLIAKAVGEPKPTVTWLKDGREILRTNRIYHHFVTGDGESHLIAECVVSKTSGIFSCKAENPNGTVIAETQVIVQRMKPANQLANVAPKFTIPLTDMGIVNGHPTTLSCNVTGSPEPTLEWIYIDDSGHKINLTSSTTDWTECRFGKVAELKSERVLREQRGTYQCIATNSSGQATTQCYLLVGELSDEPAGPPRFVKCLQDTWTPLKESIEFSVELAGFPTPDLTWYHNEKKINEGKDVKITFPSDTTSVLSIKNVSLASLGMYFVEASNIHGVLRTAGRLNVSDERRKAEPPQFKHVLEPVLAVQPKVAFSEEHPRASSSAATARVKKGAAPMFLQGLEDMDLKAGASAAVAGKLGRKLRPHRSTTNDADKLAKALAQSLRLDEPRASIDSRPESAANAALDEVRAAINSRNKRVCRPKFMVKPKPRKVLEEYKSLRLKTAISGNPMPQVHWDKEGIILETGNKYSIYNDGDFYYLEVHHVSTFDKGFYNCTAANNEGIITCTSEIDVLPNKEDSAAQVAKRKSRKEAKAPNFIEVLPGRSQANLNESLCVECSVSAYPCASIIWTRNSVRLLPQADRYTMSYDGECASLKFISVTPGDEGTYACEAVNELGSAVTNMNLQVSGVDPNAAEGIPPLFRFEKIKSVRKVVDGSRVELAAELVQASEPLQIRWLRNKVTIVDSPSFSYSRSENMVFLTIADVFPEDGGEYTVEAKNQSGIARCTMQLDVRNNERSVADEAPRVFDFEPTTRSDPGVSVELRAKVIGHPDPVISWTKAGQKLNNEEKYMMRNEGDKFILRIANVTRADAGKYELTAINPSGQANAELELTVVQSTKTVGAKPKFNESPISVQTCEKNRAELRASFSGTPAPACRWFYNGNELIDGLDGYTITSSDTNSSLLINSVDKKHFGEYLCTIRNQNGEELANAMILSEGSSAALPQRRTIRR